MAAVFPGSVRVYTDKVDLVDTVLANHVNLLQDEVTAVQSTLGTGLLASSWAGTYTNPSTHVTLTARLTNIEAGIKSNTSALTTHASATTAVHGVSGNIVGTTNTQTLTNKTLTSPTVSSPTITGGSLTGATTITTSGAQASTARVRQTILSTVNPTVSDGTDGDVWMKYTP